MYNGQQWLVNKGFNAKFRGYYNTVWLIYGEHMVRIWLLINIIYLW